MREINFSSKLSSSYNSIFNSLHFFRNPSNEVHRNVAENVRIRIASFLYNTSMKLDSFFPYYTNLKKKPSVNQLEDAWNKL